MTVTGAIASLNATAKDVYVYSSEGEALGQATEVRRIEFAKSGTVTLVPEKGDNVDVDIEKFAFLTFKPVPVNGISSVGRAGAIVRLDGGILSVTSETEITRVTAYNVLGELVAQSAPAANSATLAVDNHGLNIVVIEAGGISQTYKIVR